MSRIVNLCRFLIAGSRKTAYDAHFAGVAWTPRGRAMNAFYETIAGNCYSGGCSQADALMADLGLEIRAPEPEQSESEPESEAPPPVQSESEAPPPEQSESEAPPPEQPAAAPAPRPFARPAAASVTERRMMFALYRECGMHGEIPQACVVRLERAMSPAGRRSLERRMFWTGKKGDEGSWPRFMQKRPAEGGDWLPFPPAPRAYNRLPYVARFTPRARLILRAIENCPRQLADMEAWLAGQ